MSDISFDLSGKIDQQTVAALSALKKIANSLEIPFFVVGATARDFLLRHCYGIEPLRMTRDIDLGVEVSSWEQFGKLAKALTASGEFIPDRREQQRFHYDYVSSISCRSATLRMKSEESPGPWSMKFS